MSRVLITLLAFTGLSVLGWVAMNSGDIVRAASSASAMSIIGIFVLYGLAHVFRIIRLALLTLDQRKGIFPLASIHALTAFPSSFFPFKIGELLRLGGFFYVYDDKKKALAVWLAERFGDILTIAMFILFLYLFNVSIPDTLRVLFVVFIAFSALALFAFLAVSKILVYLNRYLVLSSHSERGLAILKFSYLLRSLEESIYHSLEGRFIGMLLLSIAIWSCEVLALVAFLRSSAANLQELTQQFIATLSGNAPAELAQQTLSFSTYQSITLAILAVVFIAVTLTVRRIKVSEQ